jgi:5-methylcytosine-specific restriction endonuclease McrA
MKVAKRQTHRRNRHRRVIGRSRPPCHLCGEEIDYEAHWLDPLSFTIDHIIPLAMGGLDELENIAAAHRKCNRSKGDGRQKLVKPAVAFVTDRAW